MSRFLLGFVVGAAVGAAAVILTTPQQRPGLPDGVAETVRNALDAGRRASAARAERMWSDYRQRIATQPGS